LEGQFAVLFLWNDYDKVCGHSEINVNEMKLLLNLMQMLSL